MFEKEKRNGSHRGLDFYKPGQIVPVHTAKNLLNAMPSAAWLQQLSDHLGLPSEHFHALYQQLAENFAIFVQLLPVALGGALGGILSEAFFRAELSLTALKAEQNWDSDFRKTYAVFSAALLQHIEKVMVHQKVLLTDAEGHFVCFWAPFQGAMQMEQATFYQIQPCISGLQRNSHLLAAIFSYLLMPPVGLSWLAEDVVLFAEWLRVISGEGDQSSGHLKAVISQLPKNESRAWQGLLVQGVDANGLLHGAAFLEWLRKGLAEGSIKMNNAEAGVHVVDGAVFLEYPLIFKAFCDQYPKAVNAFLVYQQVHDCLGIPRRDPNAPAHDQFIATYPDSARVVQRSAGTGPFAGRERSIRYGIRISDAGVLFTHASKTVEGTAFVRPVHVQAKVNALPGLAALMRQVKLHR